LDIVNCSRLSHKIVINKAYICPTEGSAYSHKRCKYFGMYKDKSVAGVAEIEAVINVFSNNEAEVCWVNKGEDEGSLIARAIEKVVKLRKNELPRRVFY
jgi:hypothetical protein